MNRGAVESPGASHMSEPSVIAAGWCTVDPRRRDAVVDSQTTMPARPKARATTSRAPFGELAFAHALIIESLAIFKQ